MKYQTFHFCNLFVVAWNNQIIRKMRDLILLWNNTVKKRSQFTWHKIMVTIEDTSTYIYNTIDYIIKRILIKTDQENIKHLDSVCVLWANQWILCKRLPSDQEVQNVDEPLLLSQGSLGSYIEHCGHPPGNHRELEPQEIHTPQNGGSVHGD